MFSRIIVITLQLGTAEKPGTLIEAVAILRRQYPRLQLLLFGHGGVDIGREEQFSGNLAQFGLSDAVRLLGPIDDSDLAWLYAHTTAFVFPSLYEGFGLPVLEAMASGACVVARNASAMAEITGAAAALIETREPAALAATISALLDAPDQRAHRRGEARTRA